MTTYYINADTGNDTTGDGSSGNPWKTISKAHTSASDGDTIVCQDSTAAFLLAGGQSISKSLTITGEQNDGSGAIFDGAGASLAGNQAAWDFTGASKTITIQKVRFTNILAASTNSPIFRISGASQTITFTNVYVYNIGIHSSFDLGGVMAGINGGACAGSTVNLLNSLFYDLYWNGGAPASGWSGASVFGNRNANPFNYVATGCTIRLKSSHGMAATSRLFGMQSGTATCKNLIAVDPDSVVSVGSVSSSYSCYYQFASPPAGTGDITSDPLFVDAANVNFNLRPSSPCVSTGTL